MKTNATDAFKEEEIIRKIRTDGSSEYFELLYHKYHKKVFDKCYSFVKNRRTAKELTEDIFSKTFEQLASFRQLSSFSSWLFSITYNHCIDYLRKNKKLHYPSWNREHEIPEIIDEAEEIIDDFTYENLMVILEIIHPEEKALLQMKYQDNLSLSQISSALRISESAAKMRIKRARTRVIYLYTNKFLKEK